MGASAGPSTCNPLARDGSLGGLRESARVAFGREAVRAGDDQRRKPAEWRQTGFEAHLGLDRVEALRVAGQQGPDDRVTRLPSLDHAHPGPVATTDTASAAGEPVGFVPLVRP